MSNASSDFRRHPGKQREERAFVQLQIRPWMKSSEATGWRVLGGHFLLCFYTADNLHRCLASKVTMVTHPATLLTCALVPSSVASPPN